MHLPSQDPQVSITATLKDRLRKKWIGVTAVALTALAIFYGYRQYGPTPWRTLRLFVTAFNAGDFHEQYKLFVRNERGGLPLIPEGDFRTLLAAMKPPFPRGARLSMTPSEYEIQERTGGITVAILNRGEAPPPTGQWPGKMDVGLQRTENGWEVRGFFTYLAYYLRNYGEEGKERFWYLYHQAAYRRGLLTADARPG